ncbi:P-loop NTPase, partial [Acidiphilium rubrum]|uniref:P-loop NTPase n=3 Tax=Acidiphilium TaxID=522 RepID=UPI002B582627
MINSKTPRHLAERVAAELLPDAIAGLDRAAAQVGPLPVAPKDRETTLRPVPVELVPPRIEVQAPVQRGEIISRQSMEDAGMVVARGRRDQAGEEFRIVRQHILQSIGAMGGKADGPGAVCPNVVMVTSAKHGEGKSFTALNLANILAEGGDRPVVLIDADIGGNSLSRHFGLESRPGLLDLAVSPRQLANALAIPTEPDNLTFIPIGGGADGDERSDLSSRQPVRALVERLATQFRDSILVALIALPVDMVRDRWHRG